jgi:shikimate dehydrogenase
VNTITVESGRLRGYNTDVEGVHGALVAAVDESLAGQPALILGAGGAARAVGLALRREGAVVAIAARRTEAARDVAAAVGAGVATWPPPSGSWDLLVNATPVGSRAVPGTPHDGPLDGQLVYDLVYDPESTELMQAAAARGCGVIGGLEMLVAQAERQFEIWTDQRPPAGLFMDAAISAMRNR